MRIYQKTRFLEWLWAVTFQRLTVTTYLQMSFYTQFAPGFGLFTVCIASFFYKTFTFSHSIYPLPAATRRKWLSWQPEPPCALKATTCNRI